MLEKVLINRHGLNIKLIRTVQNEHKFPEWFASKATEAKMRVPVNIKFHQGEKKTETLTIGL